MTDADVDGDVQADEPRTEASSTGQDAAGNDDDDDDDQHTSGNYLKVNTINQLTRKHR